MQFLTPGRALVTAACVLSAAFVLSRLKFIHLVRRMRWMLLSLWVIYAYTTPGELDKPYLPSIEGMQDGALQLMRLLASLAGLAILLDRLHRQQMMVGLYSLFAPLQWLGVSRERLAVRLALTLHYAEVAMLRSLSWQDHLQSLFEPQGEAGKIMELPVYHLGLADALLLAGSLLLLWMSVI
jgi:energy-coupling factor transport system permease protein